MAGGRGKHGPGFKASPNAKKAVPKANLSERKQTQRDAAKKSIHATNVSREAALAFSEADENGDGVLTFDEFKDCIQRLRAKTGMDMDADDEGEVRKLFESIDNDKSGTIEMDEYFIFALDVASSMGCGLEVIFQKYDTSGEGHLDANEFASAVEDLGFSTHFAHDLFVEMDDDNSGTVDCSEIGAALRQHVSSLGEDTKKFLATLAFQDADTWKQSQQVDGTTGHADVTTSEAHIERLAKDAAKLVGPDSDSLREQIQEMLKGNMLKDSDFYNLLVMPLVKGDVTQELTRDVFIAGLHRLGYKGPPSMLITLYKKIDNE